MREKYNAYINSAEWSDFKRSIFSMRGYMCETCGTQQGRMHIHHLTYARFGHELPEDVRILCKSCHTAIHSAEQVSLQ